MCEIMWSTLLSLLMEKLWRKMPGSHIIKVKQNSECHFHCVQQGLWLLPHNQKSSAQVKIVLLYKNFEYSFTSRLTWDIIAKSMKIRCRLFNDSFYCFTAVGTCNSQQQKQHTIAKRTRWKSSRWVKNQQNGKRSSYKPYSMKHRE